MYLPVDDAALAWPLAGLLCAVLLAAQAVAQAQPSGELAHLVTLAGADERHPDAAVAGASGAADPVDVGLMVGGRVEVDHVRDAVDVDPARGDVGRDERIHTSGLEARERPVALALGLVAVDRDGLEGPCASRRLTRRSAPRLVRTNTIARSRSPSSCSISASSRCSSRTATNRCSTSASSCTTSAGSARGRSPREV